MAIIATVVGKLVHEPEMQYSAKGTAFLRLSVYSNEYDMQAGKFTGKARITVFGQRAENLQGHARKGCVLQATGRVELDPATGGVKIWTKADGSQGAQLAILADSVDIVAWPEDGAPGGEQGG